MTNATYNLSLDRFAWCWQARAKTLWSLTGVYVEPREAGGVYMVATDWVIMAVAFDEKGTCPEPSIIKVGADIEGRFGPETWTDEGGDKRQDWPVDPYARLKFGAVAIGETVIGETNENFGTILRIGGKFPDWRKAIRIREGRQPKPGPVGMINPALLSRMSYRGGGVGLFPRSGFDKKDGKTPSIVVLCADAPWACGFLMPVVRDGWAKDSLFARELLGDEEPPLRLAVWPEGQGE